MKPIRTLAFALLIALGSLNAHAQLKPGAGSAQTPIEAEIAQINDIGELMGRIESYENAKDWTNLSFAWRRMTILRPYSTDALYQLARSYSLANNLPGAYDSLIRLQKQGMRYDPDKSEDFSNIRNTKVYEYIAKNLQANANPFGTGKVAFTLKSDVELIESMSYDAVSKRFFFGSIRTGEVLSSDGNGVTRSFLKADPSEAHFGVFSLLVDSQRQRLYVGSSAQPMFEGYETADFGRAAILEIDLKTGARLKKHLIPYDGGAHIPVAMTQAKDGTIYISDAMALGIYRLAAGKVEPFFGSDSFTSLRGIALSKNDDFLYLSDYELGLYLLSIKDRQAGQISVGQENLGGVEGLYRFNDELLLLQTGTYPARLQRAVIGKDPGQFKVFVPLEANKPEFTEPTVGAIVGKELFYLVNSQLLGYDATGKPVSGMKPTRRVIYRTSLTQPLPAPPPTPEALRKRLEQQRQGVQPQATPPSVESAKPQEIKPGG
jgi:hypothetical protein